MSLVILNAIILNVVMLNIFMLDVVMLNIKCLIFDAEFCYAECRNAEGHTYNILIILKIKLANALFDSSYEVKTS